MKSLVKTVFVVLLGIVAITCLVLLTKNSTWALLTPEGAVGKEERDLIVIATTLMAAVVVPVFVLTFLIAWRYRATNTKAKYTPNWEHNVVEEFIWWAVPCTIIVALAVITWNSSHALDPFKPLASEKRPLTIQVIALPWKWLFIYKDEGVATVNTLLFPAETPLTFEITADAPMNSFWIPQLGGQIYAMSGMVSKLHLIADNPGTYEGISANFSGEGFSGMKFKAGAVSEIEFDQWIRAVRKSQHVLDEDSYAALSKPSSNVAPMHFSSVQGELFNSILSKYMMPMETHSDDIMRVHQ